MGEIIAGTRASASSPERPAHFTSSIMTYPISEIEGLSAFAANKLKAQGIRTTDALLEAASTVKGRKALSAKTGISEQAAGMGQRRRLHAHPRHGRAKVGLVRAAGVTTVRELALPKSGKARPEHAGSQREAKARPHPALGEVGRRHHRKAKKLPPKISY